jgi:hypothetical protein
MHRAGFEPRILVSEREKKLRALDYMAAVTIRHCVHNLNQTVTWMKYGKS